MPRSLTAQFHDGFAIEQRDALRLAVADALPELLDERLHVPGVRRLTAQVVEERPNASA